MRGAENRTGFLQRLLFIVLGKYTTTRAHSCVVGGMMARAESFLLRQGGERCHHLAILKLVVLSHVRRYQGGGGVNLCEDAVRFTGEASSTRKVSVKMASDGTE